MEITKKKKITTTTKKNIHTEERKIRLSVSRKIINYIGITTRLD